MIFDICKKIEDAQGRCGGQCEPEHIVLSNAGLANFDSQKGHIISRTRQSGHTCVCIYRKRRWGEGGTELSGTRSTCCVLKVMSYNSERFLRQCSCHIMFCKSVTLYVLNCVIGTIQAIEGLMFVRPGLVSGSNTQADESDV